VYINSRAHKMALGATFGTLWQGLCSITPHQMAKVCGVQEFDHPTRI